MIHPVSPASFSFGWRGLTVYVNHGIAPMTEPRQSRIFEPLGKDIITEAAESGHRIPIQTRMLACLVVYKAGPAPEGIGHRICLLNQGFRSLVAEFGLKHRAVRNGLRLLERWPAQNPLIVGRERTGAAGKPDALILRDRPPDGDWVWAGHRLLEAQVPFWVKRSIWLIRCYHRNDRFYWIPRDSCLKVDLKRGHRKTSLVDIADGSSREARQARVDRLLLDLESVGIVKTYKESAYRDFRYYCTLDDDDQARLDELAKLYRSN